MSSHEDTVAPYESTGASNEAYETFIEQFITPEEEEMNRERAGKNKSMRDLLRRPRVKKTSTEAGTIGKEGDNFMGVSTSSTAVPEAFEGIVASSRPAPAMSQAPPWWPKGGYDPNLPMHLMLHEELVDYTKWVVLNDDEVKAREEFVARINGVCKDLWPQCELKVFGSFLSGLSLPSGDIDLSLQNVPVGAVEAVRMLSDKLLSQGQLKELELRETARVPIVKLVDLLPPHVEVDVSVQDNSTGEPDSSDTTKFVMQEGVEKYPAFKPLMIFLKTYLASRKLNLTFTGGVGSYLAACLVIAFLQQHPTSFGYSHTAEGNESLGHLLVDMLQWLGRDLRCDMYGLSVTNGGRTFSKAERRFDVVSKRNHSNDIICMESPLEPSSDIGNKCFQWRTVRASLFHASMTLCDYVHHWDQNRGRSLIQPLVMGRGSAEVEAIFERYHGEGRDEEISGDKPMSKPIKVAMDRTTSTTIEKEIEQIQHYTPATTVGRPAASGPDSTTAATDVGPHT
ncbi:conserved hypothetical protein [Perkinsus marinus ATCC 50983]|uniref:Poly(A) RNA polymerase mitochondrial-like central palm domain-containing protein n=1 Tax=Perkinsus marinus (strain ATCC 50983 / TXsc) TaxID=423536 RepID=C5LNW3_PERM5|nr:conserved hypothetical protein [Perkinsus marinus ATCC 50983]EER01545.1 conserved hypothetical protein [Perkinsus marinus ATCC 50983]|eukprot:XP_002768827.1 conserved hypothetical protein [Perkinsus marinus ATCC 50983]